MKITTMEPAEDMRQKHAGLHIGRQAAGVITAVLMATLLTGCEVTNPGPVQDEFLDLAEAHQALVNGAGARLSGALGYVATTAGFAAREIFPTGQTSGGHTAAAQAGRLLSTDVGTHWTRAQQARWIAEDAIRRFTGLGPGKVAANILAEAYLWAGYANRLLGENMCEAVFNGGPAEPNIKYFERAQAHFANAIATGTGSFKTAGYAGRASVRVWLKDWTGAVSDAQQVPLAFAYTVASDIADEDTRNQIYYSNANTPYRSYTGWQTWFEGYHNATGDPRVPWAKDSRFPFGNATLQGYGAVPWSFQTKYPANNSPYRVSTGREMVLIRAEALLGQGQWPAAMDLINSLRASVVSKTTGQPLAAWTANSLTEAWTFFKRERGIELWLEARRLGDMRRWDENKTPGALDWPNYEAVSVLFKNNPPSRCFPIPDSERDTNPHF